MKSLSAAVLVLLFGRGAPAFAQVQTQASRSAMTPAVSLALVGALHEVETGKVIFLPE